MTVIGEVPADGHRGRWVADGAVQVLHESERTVVSRVALASGDTVISKQFRGPDSEQRMRHERSMLQRLAGLEYVSQLAGDTTDNDTILLADTCGVAVGSVLTAGPMGLAE
jgi:hypothetical protein